MPRPLLLLLCLAWPAFGDTYYLTDLEGSRIKLEAFYRSSGAFTFDSNAVAHLKPEHTLVYGGDATDRYLGSRFVVRELLRHHRENPKTVRSLAGNREIKSLRIRSELSPRAVARPPFWTFSTPEADWLTEAQSASNPVRRLKHMLSKTMGAPNYFELQRQELQSEKGRAVDDAEVVRSFVQDMSPGGDFLNLIAKMELGLRLGSTLFIHGGLTAQNAGYSPNSPYRADTVDFWLLQLNSWFRGQLARQFLPIDWSGEGPRVSEDLLNFPMPGIQQKSQPLSVVTGRHVDDHNNPLFPTESVSRWMLARGIRRLVVGHTPIGDAVVVVRTPGGELEILYGDNSYTSDESNGTWIVFKGENLEQAETHGAVKVGDGWVPITAQTRIGHPSWIGRLLKNGARVIGQDGKGQYATTHMQSFRVTNALVSEQELLGNLAGESFPPDLGVLPEGAIGYFPGSFDPPTEAHKAIVLAAVKKLGLKKVFLVANIFGPKDYSGSVVERVDMLKILFRGCEGLVEIRGEPFAGKEAFFQSLKASARGPIYNIVGQDGYDLVPAEVRALRDRYWGLIPRAGYASKTEPNAQVIDLSIALQHRTRSSTDLRRRLANAESDIPGMDREVQAFAQANHLYEPFEDVAAVRNEYAATFAEFQLETRRRLPTLALKDLPLPPFKDTQSRGAWLEKFILWTIQHHDMKPANAGAFSDAARVIFSSKGWESKFPIVKLKSGVPSGRCLQYLLGATAILPGSGS